MENPLEKLDFKPWDMELKQFCVLMHLAQFAGYVVPLAGFILPFFMWFSFKDKNSVIDAHGKNIINWMITSIIYAVVFGLMCFILIGFPLVFALIACGIIFPILGAIKANENIVFNYPLTIRFLR